MGGRTGRPGFERDLPGPVDLDGDQLLPLGDDDGHAWRRPPRDSRPPRPPRVGVPVEAALAAGAGLLALPGLGQLQREALVRSDALFVVGVLVSVGAAFALAAGLHRWLGGGRRRDAVAVGAVTSALAGTAWGAVAIGGGWVLWQYLPPRTVLWAAALAAVVVAVRGDGVAARLAGGLAGVTTAVAIASALQPGWPLLAAYVPGPVPTQAPGHVHEPQPSGARPTPPQAPASPTFGDLCHPDELEISTSTPEPAGSDVVTTLTATNVGGRECLVEGWPSLHLSSDGVDLALVVHVRESPPAGEHVDAVPVPVAPGGSAQTQVWWPSWGAAADLDADQQLQVGVGGGREVVDLPPGDRWDVVRSAEAYVVPWQPTTP